MFALVHSNTGFYLNQLGSAGRIKVVPFNGVWGQHQDKAQQWVKGENGPGLACCDWIGSSEMWLFFQGVGKQSFAVWSVESPLVKGAT